MGGGRGGSEARACAQGPLGARAAQATHEVEHGQLLITQRLHALLNAKGRGCAALRPVPQAPCQRGLPALPQLHGQQLRVAVRALQANGWNALHGVRSVRHQEVVEVHAAGAKDAQLQGGKVCAVAVEGVHRQAPGLPVLWQGVHAVHEGLHSVPGHGARRVDAALGQRQHLGVGEEGRARWQGRRAAQERRIAHGQERAHYCARGLAQNGALGVLEGQPDHLVHWGAGIAQHCVLHALAWVRQCVARAGRWPAARGARWARE